MCDMTHPYVCRRMCVYIWLDAACSMLVYVCMYIHVVCRCMYVCGVCVYVYTCAPDSGRELSLV